MDSKVQKSELKNAKKSGRTAAKLASIRIKVSAKKTATSLLNEANLKKQGRKIKLDQLIELAMSLITPEHIKMLQEQSLTNEDRKEILRQKYVSIRGPISKDEFTGFIMTAEFHDFLREQSSRSDSDVSMKQVAQIAG
jgi:Rps23 Pro-64 3,4-dihydroxylase Tpa1-like proline 4-hydroxylase